ncbi:expressed unknown protein [Seminavis robusta]|uniref:Major facilitator superfamily (MFS) profile domain-containing protein n=1 Tax=Seminavis robusta TaxID=568900 RepID=A0A9N8HR81_9STRA|nr:expressed unknown protein [Seminavis robusta]|eukprot:Sro1052_g235780.1 n/a (840) ;mRNA; f:3925-6563
MPSTSRSSRSNSRSRRSSRQTANHARNNNNIANIGSRYSRRQRLRDDRSTVSVLTEEEGQATRTNATMNTNTNRNTRTPPNPPTSAVHGNAHGATGNASAGGNTGATPAEIAYRKFEVIRGAFLGALDDVRQAVQTTIQENEREEDSSAAVTHNQGTNDNQSVRSRRSTGTGMGSRSAYSGYSGFSALGFISLQPHNPMGRSANDSQVHGIDDSMGDISHIRRREQDSLDDGSDLGEFSHPSDCTTCADARVFSRSIAVLRFAIFADAINSQVLGPNYALLVQADGHEDSFTTTEPFQFAGAYYFIPMTADVGMVLSSILMGYYSDQPHVGRTKCILACMYVGAVGSILKFLARDSFWTFCAANFFTGLFGGSLAVGMAYVSDVFNDRMQTDAEIGMIVATNMIGRTGGGVIAIAMQKMGLFVPLWVSAAVSALAGVLCHLFMYDAIDKHDVDSFGYYEDDDQNEESQQDDGHDEEEQNDNNNNNNTDNANNTLTEGSSKAPSNDNINNGTRSGLASSLRSTSLIRDASTTTSESPILGGFGYYGGADYSQYDEEDGNYPTKLDYRTLWNILAGELTDNLGSIGLVPICLSPLMFQTFYAQFVENDQEPIMSANAYKYIYVFIAVIVVPGAVIAPLLFQKFGPALCAVGANLLTGAVTLILLQIATLPDQPTSASYAAFVSVLYLSFPLTVISQLSTGPMLDRIAPLHQRGQIQGLNMAAMNLAGALGPFLYGILSDATSTSVTLYTSSAVSALAALVNYMLVGDERFGPQTEDDDEGYPIRASSAAGDIAEDLASRLDSVANSTPSDRHSRSILPSTTTRSVGSMAQDLHVEFMPSIF